MLQCLQFDGGLKGASRGWVWVFKGLFSPARAGAGVLMMPLSSVPSALAPQCRSAVKQEEVETEAHKIGWEALVHPV